MCGTGTELGHIPIYGKLPLSPAQSSVCVATSPTKLVVLPDIRPCSFPSNSLKGEVDESPANEEEEEL